MSAPFQRSDIQGVVCICSSDEDKIAAIPNVSPSLNRFRILLLFLDAEGIPAGSGDGSIVSP